LREWGNIIKMDVEEIEWEIVDWVRLTDDSGQWLAVVNTVMNCQVATCIQASQGGLSSMELVT
jgi:hypothetical protein